MLKDNTNNNQSETTIDEEIDNQLAVLPADDPELIKAIVEARDKESLQRQFDAFNMAQSKQNALRIIKLNSLLTKVEDQAIERFEKRPDQVSNKELLDYMQVVASQIDRSQHQIDTLIDKPMINIKHQKNEVNVNIGTELDREGKEHVVDAIKELLNQLKNPSNTNQLYLEQTDNIDDQRNESSDILIDPEDLND